MTSVVAEKDYDAEKGMEVVQALPELLHDNFQKKFSACPAEKQASLIKAIEEIAEMLNAQDIDAAPILTTGKMPE